MNKTTDQHPFASGRWRVTGYSEAEKKIQIRSGARVKLVPPEVVQAIKDDGRLDVGEVRDVDEELVTKSIVLTWEEHRGCQRHDDLTWEERRLIVADVSESMK